MASCCVCSRAVRFPANKQMWRDIDSGVDIQFDIQNVGWFSWVEIIGNVAIHLPLRSFDFHYGTEDDEDHDRNNVAPSEIGFDIFGLSNLEYWARAETHCFLITLEEQADAVELDIQDLYGGTREGAESFREYTLRGWLVLLS